MRLVNRYMMVGLGDMTKNVYQGIFQNCIGFSVYNSIFSFHAQLGQLYSHATLAKGSSKRMYAAIFCKRIMYIAANVHMPLCFASGKRSITGPAVLHLPLAVPNVVYTTHTHKSILGYLKNAYHKQKKKRYWV